MSQDQSLQQLVDRLKEENEDLKAKVKSLTKPKPALEGQKSSQALATFSPLKEPTSEAYFVAQPSLTDTKDPSSHKLTEVGQRLLTLLTKLGCNIDRYRHQDLASVHILKDMIYDISQACDDLSHSDSQSQNLFSRHPYHRAAKPQLNQSNLSQSDTTMEVSNLNIRNSSGDRATDQQLRSQLLEEKEKRLMA